MNVLKTKSWNNERIFVKIAKKCGSEIFDCVGRVTVNIKLGLTDIILDKRNINTRRTSDNMGFK